MALPPEPNRDNRWIMLYEMTVPQFKKMLLNLGRLLDKGARHAEARKFDVP